MQWSEGGGKEGGGKEIGGDTPTPIFPCTMQTMGFWEVQLENVVILKQPQLPQISFPQVLDFECILEIEPFEVPWFKNCLPVMYCFTQLKVMIMRIFSSSISIRSSSNVCMCVCIKPGWASIRSGKHAVHSTPLVIFRASSPLDKVGKWLSLGGFKRVNLALTRPILIPSREKAIKVVSSYFDDFKVCF